MAQIQEDTAEEQPGRSGGWQPSGGLLLLGAVLLIAVPVLVGFILMRGDDSSPADEAVAGTSTDQGMGGGMSGDTEAAAGAARAEGVRNFDEIQATDITLEYDTASGTAVLRVSTTIDVACSVVYGPTAALGSIATDTDMAGGGHSDHRPRLVGLVPDTTYWYRLQGTGADGSIYQSDLVQFTFPAGDVAAVQPPGPNVADMATVSEVSSEYSDAFAAANAIDGDLSTEWSSAGDGDDAFIELDFGEDMLVEGVGFRTREMSDGTSIALSFTVTVDGRTYGPFPAGAGLAVELLEAEGQVIRFDVDTSTGGNTGAVEVEVYGEPSM